MYRIPKHKQGWKVSQNTGQPKGMATICSNYFLSIHLNDTSQAFYTQCNKLGVKMF